MKFRFKLSYVIGIALTVLLILANVVLFLDTRWFWTGIIIAFACLIIQPLFDVLNENKRQKEIELKFLEFIRSLVESVKSGISIPNSVIHIAKKDYGALQPYVQKLANQIEWGIPTRKALTTFGYDTENVVIKRSISIMVEAEKSGGDITDVLTSVVESVLNVKKIKEERKASTFSQVIQGYVVFFIFIGIMLVLQLWLFPKITGLSSNLAEGLGSLGVSEGFNLDRIFFSLIIVQGFFAGIMIGKFSEGTLKRGLLHSAVLIVAATLIITTVKGTL